MIHLLILVRALLIHLTTLKLLLCCEPGTEVDVAFIVDVVFTGIAVDDDDDDGGGGVDMAMVLEDEGDAFVLPVLRFLIIINF